MYLKRVKRFSQEDLFRQLREVRCMGNNRHLKPYENANFEIRLARPDDYEPSALYVLRWELGFLGLLLDELLLRVGGFENIDTLVEYEDEYGHVTRMIPPIVEYTDFGAWIILDGEHRSFIARHRRMSIPMLFIDNVSVPYPCTPLSDSWNSVEITERVPILKRYRRSGLNDTQENEKDLHRNLSSFGSQGTRKPHSPV